MEVLDFWSGWKQDVQNLWTPQYWIAALQGNVVEEINSLIIHAFDPLEIKTPSSSRNPSATFHFHNNFNTLPDRFDTICALHPNPGVLYPHWYCLDDWSFQHGRYMSLLTHVIEDKLKSGGRIILQFDNELENIWPWNGSEIFIQKITRERFYRVEEITRNTESPQFPPGVYQFSSFHVLEKKMAD